MQTHNPIPLTFILIFLVISHHACASSAAPPPPGDGRRRLPLSTESRWVVDSAGRRVKLACVNWPAHLEVAVAEGLSHSPLDAISKRIAELGFNCVRLTWPTYLVTNRSVGSMTVRSSFISNGLAGFVAGVRANNPSILDVPLVSAFQAVVQNLADNDLMIILDNHVTKPAWCCGQNDGNGFFGEHYFNPHLWLQGLKLMATMFNHTPNVVAMSLRNELRGPLQNVTDWYTYMQSGAEVVHAANPNVVIILSGLSYDSDLSFLRTHPLTITFATRQKLAFEVHWYAFSAGRGSWVKGNPNDVCQRVVAAVESRALFLLGRGWPVIVSEFGVDVTGENEDDDRYLSCLMGVAAEHDLDWAYWELGGSYYRRVGVVGLNETYGVLGRDWNTLQNPKFMEKLSAIQPPFRACPGVGNSSIMHQVIFHPLSGKCIVRKLREEPNKLSLGPCSESQPWNYSLNNGTITLNSETSHLYLQAQGRSKPVRLGVSPTSAGSIWKQISSSRMHLSTQLNGEVPVCLDVGDSGDVITGACKCLSNDNGCDPASQWFKIIPTSRINAN